MNILVIVAHPDDEILGCGASLLKHKALGDSIDIIFLSDGETSRSTTDFDTRYTSVKSVACELGASVLGILNYPDNRLDSIPRLEIISKCESLLEVNKYDLVYTHFFGDLNIDHRVTFEVAVTLFRPVPNTRCKEIRMIEIPSSSKWMGVHSFIPDIFCDVTDYIDEKIKLLKHYDKEMRSFPHERSYEYVESLSKVHGASVGVDRAEGFMLLRKVW